MSKEISDDLIIRWLGGKLTKHELDELKSSPDFPIYKKIAEASSEFKIPDFHNKKYLLEKIKAKTYKKKKPIINIHKKWLSLAAASITLLFGLFYFLNQSTNYTTKAGEKLTILLPDNSEVLLNSKSSISFNKNDWDKTRIIKLTGEAYFKVEKGKNQFQVQSKEGNITVLGTQFNVNSKTNFLEVHCFEGKVKVNRNQVEKILTKGQVFRQIEQKDVEFWEMEYKQPTWNNGETYFKSTPLKYVITTLENNYNIEIKTSKVNLDQVFTGSLSNTNLKVALQTIASSVEITYTFSKNKKSIILSK